MLLVDDHLLVHKQMTHELKCLGCEKIDHAADVAEARTKISATHYDVVFLDWHLPGKTG